MRDSDRHHIKPVFFSMQQKVKDWEQYEGEKTQLLQYLKKAESELERPPETLAQDTAQKDFQSKKVSNIEIK